MTRQTLSEADAKALLRGVGLPVVEGRLVRTGAEALEAAGELGYPVVLKASAVGLAHKTELGLVRVGIEDGRQLARAHEAVSARFTAWQDARGQRRGDEGLLVERCLESPREFVAGLTRDPQYGPVVMFGLGGIFTEALRDVAFALAPLTEWEAAELVAAIRARRLLGATRGEPPVDLAALSHLLVALGGLAVSRPDLAELDLNPILVEAGSPVVVDALAVLSEPTARTADRASQEVLRSLGRALRPRSVAVVGASNEPTKWGGALMTNLLGAGFEGRIYPVNPRGEEIFGLRTYPSVFSLPEAPDLALLSVPGAALPAVVEECGCKGVPGVVVISAGFSEAGPAGASQERELSAVASSHGMALLGPNTIGLISTPSRLCAMGAALLHPATARTGFFSQSGNVAVQLLQAADSRGGGVGTFVGLGNEAQLTAAHLLAYFGTDPDTDLILGYVEGFDDARAFYETARQVTPRKPVVLLRGGASAEGGRAASSHTGAMAGSEEIFQGMARQAGLIVTTDPDEFLDLSFALPNLPLPRGRRVVVLTMGGGWGVLCADEVARTGLDLVPLPPDVLHSLDALLPSFWSRQNPIDLVASLGEGVVETALERVVECESVDAVLLLGALSMFELTPALAAEARRLYRERGLDEGKGRLPDPQQYRERQLHIRYHVGDLLNRHGKPILNVELASVRLPDYEGPGPFAPVVLPSPLRAARVLAQMARYAAFRGRQTAPAEPASDVPLSPARGPFERPCP